MDPIVTAALIAMISAVVLFLMTLKGNKGQQMQVAGDALRDDLLAAATLASSKAAAQDAKIERLEGRIERLEEEARRLRDERDAARDERDEERAKNVVYLNWGTYSTEPVPRTQPPWRQVVS